MSKEFLHNIIKNELSELGYLPNLPYHLISDSEMFDAFIREPESQIRDPDMAEEVGQYMLRKASDNYDNLVGVASGCMFHDYYPPFIDDSTGTSVYFNLVNCILRCIHAYTEFGYEIPDWVYAYMLRAVIGPKSSYDDICSLQSMLGLTVTGEFSIETAESCLLISRETTKLYDGSALPMGLYTKHSRINRALDDAAGLSNDTQRDCPITIFGDLNVIKYLRKSRNITQNDTQNDTQSAISLLQ